MATEHEIADTNANQQATSQEATGEVAQQASESVEPTSEGTLYDGMTGDKLHESYKSLQGEYTTNQQRLKELDGQFEAWGGADKLLETANYLANNERFAQFIAQEKMRNQYGIDESQMDDEQKKAMDLVRKIADETNKTNLDQMFKEHIEPLQNVLKEQTIESHFEAMDNKYEGWRDMQDKMAELSDSLDSSITDNPSLSDIETLYFKALVESGKMEGFAANLYKQQLEAKKGKDTGQPPEGGGDRAPQNASTIQQAYELAKQQLASQ